MKQVKKITTVAAALAAILTVTGCGLPSVGESGSSDSGSAGSDTFKATQNGNGFTLEWDKNSGGYSEVGLDSGYVGDGERADTTVVSDNYDGKHTLECGIEYYSSSSVSVGCYGNGPDYTGGTREIEKHFSVREGSTYTFYLTYGAMSSERHSTDTGYRLHYGNGTLGITRR